MQDITVYQAGGRLWSFRKLLRDHPEFKNVAQEYQKLDMLMSTVSVVHSPTSRAPLRQDVDTTFLARILLGILQRGHASIVSPFVESAILSGLGPYVREAEAPELDHTLPVSKSDALTFAQDVIACLIRGEQHTRHDWSTSYDSESERRFFDHHLSRLLGPGIALIEAQRPLPSMLSDQDANRFHSQRVDFALETPDGLKIVFEIDGPDHRGPGSAQAILDKDRTRALQKADWIVERLSADRVWQHSDIFSEVVRARVEKDPALRLLRERAFHLSASGSQNELAQRLALDPHAVARIHLAILLAMLNGELILTDDAWRIGIIERDLHIAEVAIIDLMEQMTQLAALYGIASPPAVKLVVVPAYTTTPAVGSRNLAWTAVEVRYIEPPQIFEDLGLLNLLIDVSVRTRPHETRESDLLPAHHLRGIVPMYELRTAYRRLPEAFIEWPSPRPVSNAEAVEQPLRYFLQTLFRRPDFREKQLEVMTRALQRKDVLGLLPTGGGKSLTFQLPTLLSPGTTLVIAPLKSLIDDQVDNLHRAGINRVAGLHSGQGREKKDQALREIVRGYPRFVYIAPERLHIKRFRQDLLSSPISRSLAFSVVDEAHCVSEWGHDFRPSYLSVAHQARALFGSGTGAPPVIALTATASNTVLIDILRELDFARDDADVLVSVTTFNRGELRFIPITGGPDTKRADLKRVLGRIESLLGCDSSTLFDDPERAGIVFCRYVNGEFGVMGVSAYLQSLHEQGQQRIRIYAGGQPKKWNGDIPWEDHKQRIQRAFKDNEFPTLVATSSFGMGIDKENIRYTVHYGIPQSLEALAQEAGRAGRDKKPAACAIVYTHEALNGETDYLAPNLSTEDARERYNVVPRKQQGDASRIMFLLGNSYPGVDEETETLQQLFTELRNNWDASEVEIGEATTQTLRRPFGDAGPFDKALYRLSALGVVTDYTINYGAGLVELDTERVSAEMMERNFRRFVHRYGAEEAADDVLLTARGASATSDSYIVSLRAICIFAYRVIEASRREALGNIVRTLRDCMGDGDALARRLNEFLSNNTFTARVAEMTMRVDEDEWFELLAQAYNEDLCIQLVNAADRELESNPTHAGLHLLSGLGNIRRDRISPRAIAERLLASLNYYESTFGKSPEERRSLVRRMLTDIASARPDRLDTVVAVLLQLRDDDGIARAAYTHVTNIDLRRRCTVPWLREARDNARRLRQDLVGSGS